jgi:hypothetical protein
MQRIHYSGVSLLTGDEIARGVVQYAQALAHAGGSAEIRLPVRLGDGGTASATLLIGPSSQLVTVDEASPFDELTAPEVIEQWRTAMSAIA